MALPLLAYCLSALTSPEHSPRRARVGDDIRAAAQADAEQLLRSLACFPPESASLTFRFLYRPSSSDPGRRLSVHVLGQAHRAEAAEPLSLLLSQGLLSRCHDVRAAPPPDIDWSQFRVACDVVRRVGFLRPTIPADRNAQALRAYPVPDILEAKSLNDIGPLDSLLDMLTEPVLLDLCAEPVDVSALQVVQALYAGHLQRINRLRYAEDDGAESLWSAAGEDPYRERSAAVEPLHDPDSSADVAGRRQSKICENLLLPHVRFHARVLAVSEGVARLVAANVAEWAFQDGNYALFNSRAGSAFSQAALEGQQALRAVPIPVQEAIPDDLRGGPFDDLAQLSNLAAVEEVTGLLRLPLAGIGPSCCVPKDSDPPLIPKENLFVLGYDADRVDGPSATGSKGPERGIEVEAFSTHGLFVGKPGTGKTTALLNLVLQAYERRKPVIVLDFVKTDFSVFKEVKDHTVPAVRRLAEELQVYTPGNDAASAFRFNPLEIREGVLGNQHRDSLSNCFKAAMPMEGPLDALLSQALERVYEKHPDPRRPPRMSDLYAAAKDVLRDQHYVGDFRWNVESAIEVRLGALTRGSIGRIFQAGQDVPTLSQLMTGYSVIQMGALSREKAALLTLFLVEAVCEQVTAWPSSDGELRSLLIIDEAHNVVGPKTDAAPSQFNADPMAYAAEVLCRRMAEVRAYGLAFVFADQSATGIAPQIVKLAGSMFSFRQNHSEERETVGGAMSFGPLETAGIASLRKGRGYFFTTGYQSPQKIVARDLQGELKLPPAPAPRDIAGLVRNDAWFVQAEGRRVVAELGLLAAEMNRFDQERYTVGKRAAELAVDRCRILRKGAEEREPLLTALARQAQSLRSRLKQAFDVFVRNAYRPLLGLDPGESPHGKPLHGACKHLVNRFDKYIAPDTQKILDQLDAILCKAPDARPTSGG